MSLTITELQERKILMMKNIKVSIANLVNITDIENVATNRLLAALQKADTIQDKTSTEAIDVLAEITTWSWYFASKYGLELERHKN